MIYLRNYSKKIVLAGIAFSTSVIGGRGLTVTNMVDGSTAQISYKLMSCKDGILDEIPAHQWRADEIGWCAIKEISGELSKVDETGHKESYAITPWISKAGSMYEEFEVVQKGPKEFKLQHRKSKS